MRLKNTIALLSLLFLLACDNELDINTDWKDVAVVYGLLDATADTNFIRIERGYLGSEPARNSYDKPDSLYYKELTAVLNRYRIGDNNERGSLAESYNLIQDFTSRQLNDNGPFTTEGYRLYRVPESAIITDGFEYELVVSKPSGPDVTASSRVLDTLRIIRPPDLISGREFNGLLEWTSLDGRIFLFQPYYYFYYKEYNLDTKESVIKEIVYQYPDVPRKSSGNYEIKFANQAAFFSYIANRIETKPNVLRFFDHMRFEVWGADENLTTYMNLKAPASTFNQNRPDFTNVENGVGIFASRFKVSLDNVTLSDAGSFSYRDYLNQSQIMCAKRFAFVDVSTGDTCVCNDLPGPSNGRTCPYDN